MIHLAFAFAARNFGWRPVGAKIVRDFFAQASTDLHKRLRRI